MKNSILMISLTLIIVSGCYLFDDPIIELDYQIASGEYSADSLYIDSAGLYEIVVNASVSVDIIFFSSREAIDDFSRGNVYSQNIMYPLFFENTVYEDEEVFIYNENAYIFYIIDNTGFLTSPEDDAEVSLKIYLKEE